MGGWGGAGGGVSGRLEGTLGTLGGWGVLWEAGGYSGRLGGTLGGWGGIWKGGIWRWGGGIREGSHGMSTCPRVNKRRYKILRLKK